MNFILLQAAGGSQIPFMVTMVGVVIVMYFFMIRPQQKKQKDQKSFIDSINKGDQVVTIGGLHGKVHAVDELTVTILVDKSTKLTFDKASISLEASQRIQNSLNESNT